MRTGEQCHAEPFDWHSQPIEPHPKGGALFPGKEDGLDSMGFGVPAKIGPYGVEKIYEFQVDNIREEIDRSATIIKEDIKIASEILREKFRIS
jgi:malate/lactate dehydrogenase